MTSVLAVWADRFTRCFEGVEDSLRSHAALFQLPAHHPRKSAATSISSFADVTNPELRRVEPVTGAQTGYQRYMPCLAFLCEVELGGNCVDRIHHKSGGPVEQEGMVFRQIKFGGDRKSTRLNSSHA